MDADYPSGPWTGFYTYYSARERGRMDLDLKFEGGLVSGSGTDPVGFFTIRGRYDVEKGEVWWTKTYPGRHDVFYQGYREPAGIWGNWEIHEGWRGGFHIWPKGIGEGAVEHAEEQVPASPEPRI